MALGCTAIEETEERKAVSEELVLEIKAPARAGDAQGTFDAGGIASWIAQAQPVRSAGGKTEAELLVEHHLTELGLVPFEAEYRFHPTRRWRFDWAVPHLKLAVEQEGGIWVRGGGRHNRGIGYQRDIWKYNAGVSMGYAIFRFTPDDILKGRDLEVLKQWLMRSSKASTEVQISPKG
jgi:very-short-patch-repair endonuclease